MTQKQELAILFTARPNQWVPLPDILRLGMAQYGARILELRREGYHIENKVEWIGDQKHSWFRYIPPEVNIRLNRAAELAAGQLTFRVV